MTEEKPQVEPQVKTLPLPALRQALTDSGNVQRLIAKAGREFRYVPQWGRFMVWTGRTWEPDAGGNRMLGLTSKVVDDLKSEYKSLAEDDPRRDALWQWQLQSQSAPRRKAVVDLLRGEVEVEARPEDFDARPWLLNVANGTLNLRADDGVEDNGRPSATLSPFRPSDRLTVMSSAAIYRPGDKAPKWEKFLADSLPDEQVRAFIQRFIGYCLTGRTSERLLLICVGRGANGKSVFLRVLSELLGPYARGADPELLVARGSDPHPTNVADLVGRRLVTLSELRKGRTWDEEKMKRFTGGSDKLKCRRLYEDWWEYTPEFKIVMAANERPRALDASDAFWGRVALIEWPIAVAPEDQDKELVDKLLKELPGILNWAVEGCVAWQTSGLNIPEQVKKASREYRSAEDFVGAFMADSLVFEAGAEATSEELLSASQRWCNSRNIKPFSWRTLVERLSEANVSRSRTNTRRSFLGVRMRRSADDVKGNKETN